MKLFNPEKWNEILLQLPMPHFLQTTQWASVKARYGWRPFYAVWQADDGQPQAAMLILERTLTLGGFSMPVRVLYTPKGPNMDWGNTTLRAHVLDHLQMFAHLRRAIFIKLDPDVPLGWGEPGAPQARESDLGAAVSADLRARGWRYSREQIQFRNTVLIDISPPADEILARMKQKTRYNIRLAERRGVEIRSAAAEDWPLLYRMYAETAARDGFTIRPEAYYRTVWEAFAPPQPLSPDAFSGAKPLEIPRGNSQSPFAVNLIAEVEGESVAALTLVLFRERAYYVYGMSRPLHRNKMPTYLLQWAAINLAKAYGCKTYDFWGAPETFDESDSMWGVYRFKRGWGGEVVRTLGAWDFPARPFWYRMYGEILPRVLNFSRARGR